MLSLALVLCSVAFLLGYSWHASQSLAEGGGDAVAPGARVSAVEAIDEAVRARFEKRPEAALAALDRAHQADATVPGLDLLRAELSLEQKDLIGLRKFAATARSKDDHAASAAVLLGVDKWISRGVGDRDVSTDAQFAGGYFDEATQIDFFAAPAWFFWGDFLRYAGREQEGRDRLLSALHRFNPWNSSDTIAAKAVVASVEAGDRGNPLDSAFVLDSSWKNAVSRMVLEGKALETALSAQTTLRNPLIRPVFPEKWPP